MLPRERRSPFPRLTDDNHHVTSPETDEYNCAAWAVGDDQRWWWPTQTSYWPGKRLNNTLEAFEEGLGLTGWEVCENAEVEVGYEKLAIYADTDGQPRHVARQLVDGRWTSKLGEWEDIEHEALEDLDSPDYGTAQMFMRKRQDA